MKDRFKFRAWYYDKDDENDSDNNKMFYNAQDTYDCLGGNPPLRASSFGDIIDDERWVVEQCTGLKDKNGKLIYEGDIVEIMVWDDIEEDWIETKGKVYWSKEDAAFLIFVSFDGEYSLNSQETFYGQEIKVIGNIHENEDLLEI